MYCISDIQIEFIINDIRARGVNMDSLQQDILDHICCIIEQNLEESGDFEEFYFSTIKKFYKNELKEIEDETISLLNNKHYYTMKKVMINSGVFSAIVFSLGIALKFLRWPGANVCMVSGIFFLSFVFLPLLFTLKMKEQKTTKDKLVIALGTFPAILMVLSFMFKAMHWPGSIILGYLTMGILLLVFLPIYLINGLKQPEAKVNTIVTSVLVVAGCCLWLTLVITPKGSRISDVRVTEAYLNSEQILKNEQRLTEKTVKKDSANGAYLAVSRDINEKCEMIKALIIENRTGYKTIDNDFESKDALLSSSILDLSHDAWQNKLAELKKNVEDYNKNNVALSNPDVQQIPVNSTVLDENEASTDAALNDLIRIQMFVLQNEQAVAKS